tara:strand:+ start:190 stop:360 length:171 start_codon:yes stop_codon:yes gene_type:complete
MKYEIIHYSSNNRAIKGACIECHKEAMMDIQSVLQNGFLCSDCVKTHVRIKSWWLP